MKLWKIEENIWIEMYQVLSSRFYKPKSQNESFTSQIDIGSVALEKSQL